MNGELKINLDALGVSVLIFSIGSCLLSIYSIITFLRDPQKRMYDILAMITSFLVLIWSTMGILESFMPIEIRFPFTLRISLGNLALLLCLELQLEMLSIFNVLANIPPNYIKVAKICSAIVFFGLLGPIWYAAIVYKSFPGGWESVSEINKYKNITLLAWIGISGLASYIIQVYILVIVHNDNRGRPNDFRLLQTYFCLAFLMDCGAAIVWILGYVADWKPAYFRLGEAYANVKIHIMTVCFKAIKEFTFHPRSTIELSVESSKDRESGIPPDPELGDSQSDIAAVHTLGLSDIPTDTLPGILKLGDSPTDSPTCLATPLNSLT